MDFKGNKEKKALEDKQNFEQLYFEEWSELELAGGEDSDSDKELPVLLVKERGQPGHNLPSNVKTSSSAPGGVSAGNILSPVKRSNEQGGEIAPPKPVA